MAYHRVQALDEIIKPLRNLEVKRIFLERGGLEKLMTYLIPLESEESPDPIEPCLAVKMKVFEIIYDLNLNPLEISKYGTNIYKQISKNRKASKIPELKEICITILKTWDFVMYKEYTFHKSKAMKNEWLNSYPINQIHLLFSHCFYYKL